MTDPTTPDTTSPTPAAPRAPGGRPAGPRPGGRRAGGPRPGPARSTQAPVVELASIETPPELILFNAYLVAEKEVERERQRVRQAESAKDKAAAHLKDLTAAGAPREEIAAAEQAYREQVESLRRVKAGESDEPRESAETAGADEEAVGEVGETDEDAGTAAAETDEESEGELDPDASTEEAEVSTEEVSDDAIEQTDTGGGGVEPVAETEGSDADAGA